MKRITTLKAFALSLTMVLGMLLPMTTNAQSDGFFRGGSDNYDNRDSGMELGGSTAENPTPVGSGLLVLTIAGACYVAWKRKRSLNLLLASAMLLTFTQCKKKEIASVSNNGVHITLNAGYGNGAKTDFTPATGAFVWTNGQTEYIYVGGSQHAACLGALSGTGNGKGSMTFSGTLTTTPNEGETLHFFYLGKSRNGSAVSTLDFSTQDGSIENVTNYHVAIGDGSYSSSTINYATTLNMAMAIAYFDVNGFKNASETAETVFLHGDEVYTTATIDYRNGTIAGSTKGNINLGTATAGKYVALIPSVNTETTLKFDSDSKTGAMTFLRGIQAGRYYSNSGAALTVTAGALLAGTIPGLFSVSATKMVRFSKGNLQYIGSAATPYWRFADNQWDYLGDNGQGSTSETVDRDLFGWGTSGYNHNETAYQPAYQPWATNASYNYYAYGSYTYNLYDQTGQADWGYNAISNGGNTENSGWRTPTNAEWGYVFNTRSTASGIRYAQAYVNNVNGVILLPDDWSASYYSLSNTNIHNASFGSNVISSTQWSTLELHGAVFLPAAGYRNGTSVSNVGSMGFYWSSSYSNSINAYCVFYNTLFPQGTNNRYGGQSVRLVRSAQ